MGRVQSNVWELTLNLLNILKREFPTLDAWLPIISTERRQVLITAQNQLDLNTPVSSFVFQEEGKTFFIGKIILVQENDLRIIEPEPSKTPLYYHLSGSEDLVIIERFYTRNYLCGINEWHKKIITIYPLPGVGPREEYAMTAMNDIREILMN